MVTRTKSSQEFKPLRVGLMLSALTMTFVMSHAFRTTIAIAYDPLEVEFGASARTIAMVAATFHLALALSQPIAGVAVDRYGPHRTVAYAFSLALAGCFISATSTSVEMLMAGQLLIGAGCAPTLLAAMVFIAQKYPAERFAAISGVVLFIGGAGMLLTGSPLAWAVETWSWRAGFVVLGLLSAASWVAVVWDSGLQSATPHKPGETLFKSIGSLGTIIRQPYTIGICCLAATSYAAFIALRGLWLGPLLAERYAYPLLDIGHVAAAVSLSGMLGVLIFGWIDPGGATRRTLIICCGLGSSVLYLALAVGVGSFVDLTVIVVNGFFLGYVTLQYADLRSAYPAEMTGRALSVFTMSMFSGVAATQWLSGLSASLAPELSIDPIRAALASIGVLLLLGTIAFWKLPWPQSLLRPRPSMPRNV